MRLQGWLITLTAFIMFLTFLGLPTGLTSILDDLGITINPDTSQLDADSDIETSSFWDSLFGEGETRGVLVLIGTAAVVAIGLVARGYDPSLIILPFVVFVAALFIPTFFTIIKYVMTFNQWWATSIIAIIFGALAVGFTIACVDYFAGR